ncbi:hypothetical protein CORC01_08602 [Colletotrichum orchidophilum]|uniref:Ecp2 effector protein-like domain-containing protein n=1 Tax=Colletotrichum orchidophilum TaxID=1209926 RepID=A0A1G4B429_9PEZI|nr:uncharacterized protein CORC01_08602 [Colletotrichum orchidophilum]OHE96065.1 hypothetical protein CORC01_08602 [Colletotrichum orchidophilum]
MMALITRLLAITVVALAVVAANPVAQGPGIIRDPACGSLCAFTEPPFPKAVCHEVLLDSGKCKAIFINPEVGKVDFAKVEGGIYPGAEVKQTKKNVATIANGYINADDAPTANRIGTSRLSKRFTVEKTEEPQKVCKEQGVSCLDREQNAEVDDCVKLFSFWEKTYGKWTFSALDLTGRNWLEFMRIGTCLVAIGSPAANLLDSPITGKYSTIGNLDMVGIFAQSIDHCGEKKKKSSMEVRGTISCSDFDLTFWIVATDNFDCCKPDPVLNPHN